MKPKIVTPAVGEPLDLADVKSHIKFDTSDEDTDIAAYLTAARERAEDIAGISILLTEYELTLDAFADEIELHNAPVIDIVSVNYVDSDGNTQTLASTVYTLNNNASPAMMILDYNQEYPETRDVHNAVTIRYRAGFAAQLSVDAGTDIFTVANHYYANDDVVRVSLSGDSTGALPAPLQADTDYYVVNVSGDTFQLSATLSGAAIDITDTGTGTHYIGEVPMQILQAIKMLVGHYEMNRENASFGAVVMNIPDGFYHLLSKYRTWIM